MPESTPANQQAVSDAQLLAAVREGDVNAYDILWRRHYTAGRHAAIAITDSFDPDDLTQEAFTRVLQSLRSGHGPTHAFRPYLYRTIRNTAANWARRDRELTGADLDAHTTGEHAEQQHIDRLEQTTTAQAFRSIHPRWQEAIWLIDVEGLRVAEAAPILGIEPNAVSQLVHRAREGFRDAWVRAHLRSLSDKPDCQWTVDHLGAYARNTLSPRNRRKVRDHLATCEHCSVVAAEASHVTQRIHLVLVPLILGGGAVAARLFATHATAPAVTTHAAGITTAHTAAAAGATHAAGITSAVVAHGALIAGITAAAPTVSHALQQLIER